MAWSLNNLDTRLFLDPHQGVFTTLPPPPLNPTHPGHSTYDLFLGEISR